MLEDFNHGENLTAEKREILFNTIDIDFDSFLEAFEHHSTYSDNFER